MARPFPPNHPYNIMLYHVSKCLGRDKEKIVDLARIMGLRKFGTIDNVAELFDKLEDEDCLSVFKVADLGKAFDIIDLHEAARIVREYEEKALEDKTSNVTSETPYSPLSDDPPPYRPPSGFDTQDQYIPPSNASTDELVCESLVGEEEEENIPTPTIPAKELPIKEEGMPVEQIANLIVNPDEKPPGAAKLSRKYHTVSGKSNLKDYPALSDGIFSDSKK